MGLTVGKATPAAMVADSSFEPNCCQWIFSTPVHFLPFSF